MRYRNIKTGQVIDVLSEVRGENWEMISGQAPEKGPAAFIPAVEEDIKLVKKTTRKTKK